MVSPVWCGWKGRRCTSRGVLPKEISSSSVRFLDGGWSGGLCGSRFDSSSLEFGSELRRRVRAGQFCATTSRWWQDVFFSVFGTGSECV